MKVFLQIALLAIFIIGINSVSVCNDVAGKEDDECRIYPTTMNYTHCCYYQTNNGEGCMQITDDQYENIKRFKSFYKQDKGLSSFKIKCSGEFLAYSLFALLVFLF